MYAKSGTVQGSRYEIRVIRNPLIPSLAYIFPAGIFLNTGTGFHDFHCLPLRSQKSILITELIKNKAHWDNDCCGTALKLFSFIICRSFFIWSGPMTNPVTGSEVMAVHSGLEFNSSAIQIDDSRILHMISRIPIRSAITSPAPRTTTV